MLSKRNTENLYCLNIYRSRSDYIFQDFLWQAAVGQAIVQPFDYKNSLLNALSFNCIYTDKLFRVSST